MMSTVISDELDPDNTETSLLISGTSGDDSIFNKIDAVTIDAMAGNDTITNYGSNVSINAGTGNDYISNSVPAAMDIITPETRRGGSSSADNILEASSTSDNPQAENVTITAGEGDDTIQNCGGGNIYIDGGTGNDVIGGNGSGSTILGGAGNDVISLSSTYSNGNTIQYSQGEGNDTIYGFNSYDTLQIASGNISSSVQNNGNLTLNIGSGSIVIVNAPESIWLKRENNNAEQLTIGGGNKMTNSTNNIAISGSSGADYIENSGNYVTINAAAGDDTIDNSGSSVLINGGDGDDVVTNLEGAYDAQISSGNGDDYISGIYESSKIDGGAGDDVVDAEYAYDSTINGGDGADEISGYITDSSINGGAGNDIIDVNSEEGYLNNTIVGGKGNDTIVNEVGYSLNDEEYDEDMEGTGNLYQYANADGNDVIQGFSMYDTLQITSGNISSSVLGDDGSLTIYVGSGSIVIENAPENIWIKKGNNTAVQLPIDPGPFTESDDYYSNTTKNTVLSALGGNDTIVNRAGGVEIYGGTGNDSINNDTNSNYTINSQWGYVTVDGGDGNDNIYSNDPYVSINGGAGNDSIYSSVWNYVTVDGGDGADSIVAGGHYNSINGGDGNDVISLSSGSYSNATVNGGTGNDVIYGGVTSSTSSSLSSYYTVYQYANGDGNDTVYNFSANDTLNITSGSYSSSISGSNWIIGVGSGRIVLVDAASNEYLQLLNSSGELITLTSDNRDTLPAGWKYNSAKTMVTASVASASNIDLTQGYGDGVEKVDGAKTTGGIEIIGNNDGISIKAGRGADTVIGGTGDDTVSLGAGADVYRYTGGDDVVQDYGTGADVIMIDDTEFEFVGTAAQTVDSSVIFTVKDRDDNEGTITLLKAKNKTVTFQDLDGATINPYPTIGPVVVTGTSGRDLIDEDSEGVTIDALAGNDTIISSGSEASINAGAGTDKISLTGGENITVYGGAGADTIYNESDGNNVYQFDIDSVKDGKDVIVGYNEGDSIYIGNGIYNATISGDDWKITIGSGNQNVITLKEAADQTITLVDKHGTIETIAAIDPLPTGWTYGNSAKTQLKATLASADAIDLREPYGAGVTIVDASKITGGTDIIGNDDSNSIKGGRGADEITGGTGDDTISMGGGADTYIYTGGTDFIQDFGSGADVIQIMDTDNITLQAVETVGSNVVITTSEGTITLNKGKGKNITIYGADENEILYPTVPAVTGWAFTNNNQMAKATVTAPDEIDLNESYGVNVSTVDASKATAGVVIIGNDNGNSIKGGKGADEITGGEGNDTVSLGAGNDVYVYNGGNDIVLDYKEGADTIKVNTSDFGITSAVSVNSNFVFNFNDGAGSLTIKGGKGKEIIVVDENDEQIYPGPNPITILPEGWAYYNGGVNLTATTSSAEASIDLNETYGEEVNVVDASKIRSGVEIIGNDNSISIKGGAGADYVTGGTGDDTISLGAGADTYVYTGGNDIIQGHAAVDVIQLSEDVTFEHAGTVSSDFVITTSEGTISIVGGKSKASSIQVFNSEGEQILPIEHTLPSGWKISGTTFTATTASAQDEIDLNEDYASAITKVDASKITSGVVIIGNSNALTSNSIKGGKGADTITGGSGNDTVSLGGGADVYIYTGGDDLIQDYGVGADSIQFTGDVTFDAQETVGTNVVLTTNVGNITIKSGQNKEIIVMNESGNRIYPDDVDDTIPPAGWKYNTNHTQLIATVTAPEDLDLTAYEGVTTVDASKASASVVIIGNDYNNSIKGGRGADEITGGTGNDTVSLGAGADVYIYTGGQDVIQDYNPVDTIKVGTDEYVFSSAETVGSNVVYSFNNGEGTITVVGGKNKTITAVDQNDNPLEEIITLPAGWAYNNSAKTQIKATVASADDIDLTETYGEGISTVDASKITGGASIVGNDEGNSIKGGRGADIIYGGTGDDTISLGGGADVYVYTGGEDYIHDYANADKIMFNTDELSVEAVETVGSNVIYTFSDQQGTLTLKSGRGKNVSFIDTYENEIDINMASSADLLEDDNFMTADAQISDVSEITATNYSVTNLDTQDYNSLAQNDTLASAFTYSDDK